MTLTRVMVDASLAPNETVTLERPGVGAVIIERLEVRNFRALSEAAVDLGGVTYLVGRNGAGKSTLLNALAVFFKQASATGPEEFTLSDTTCAIEISVTFRDLGPAASIEFEKYVRDGRIGVTKRVAWENGRPVESYHGTSLAFQGFRSIRVAVGQQRIAAYRAVQTDFGLPAVRSVLDVDAGLEAWEEGHRNRLELMEDDGQFFGYSNVGTGKLSKYIDFVLVPAVRDAADDASERKDSALRHLVDVVVRRAADLAGPMSELRQTVESRYAELIERPELSLAPLSDRINEAIRRYAPGANVIVRWSQPGELRLPDLSATARLVDDGVEGDVTTKGHGLQRAYIMASLQALAEVETTELRPGATAEEDRCGLVLAVEEPELYQHPAQARQIVRTFRDLVDAGGGQVQVVACTHSPIFLDVRTFDDIRVVRKRAVAGAPPRTTVSHATLETVASRLQTAHGAVGPFSAGGLRPGLVSLLNPYVAEAFFADFVVLVEGEEDKALLEAALAQRADWATLTRWAIVVVPAGGKKNLDKLHAILSELSVPCYTTFDRDGESGEPAAEVARWNLVLQRLSGIADPEPMPDTYIGQTVAVFSPNLSDVVRAEIGAEVWFKTRDAVCLELGIPVRHDSTKNPEVARAIIARTQALGNMSASLTAWATAVVEASTKALGPEAS